MDVVGLKEISSDVVVIWRWGFISLNATILYTWMVMALLTIVSWLVTRKLSVGPNGRFRLVSERHIVVSDGDTLWTHNQRANQLIIDRVDNAGEAVRTIPAIACSW